MTREEWWLRLLMISGQKLPHIRRLKGLAYQKLVLTANLLLRLGFNDKQHQQFNSLSQIELKLGLDWLALPNHYLVTYIDADYPELLRNTPSAPLALFVSGEPGNLSKPQLAMVGSRCYSHYGETWASYFSQQLSAAGLVITSGLAMGIDGISHRGALASGGVTIAVLGSGLSSIYPRGHLRLAQQILESGGSLVSEFLPFETARAEYFPKRNRIISGLSLGVLVIEAEMHSGSLITARCALEQGREVFAIPGPLGSRSSEGTHSLIQQGANLVAQPTDIIEILNSSLRWLVLEQSEPLYPELLPLHEDSDEAEVEATLQFPSLLDHVGYEPTPANLIGERAKLSASDVAIQLLDLELLGAITSVQGGYVRLK